MGCLLFFALNHKRKIDNVLSAQIYDFNGIPAIKIQINIELHLNTYKSAYYSTSSVYFELNNFFIYCYEMQAYAFSKYIHV